MSDAPDASLGSHLAALASTSARARKEAALALKALGLEARAGFAVLAQLSIHDPNPAVRAAAAEALAAVDVDGEATTLLASCLDADEPETRRRALGVLEALGPRASRAAASAARLAIEDPDDAVSEAAVAAVGVLAREADRAWLEDALDSPVAMARRRAVACAAALGEHAAPEAEQLGRLLADEDEECRRGAVLALLRLGPAAAAALPHLELALGDPVVRLFTAMTLGRIGAPARAALPALQALSEDPAAGAAIRAAIDAIGATDAGA